jgi:serine/threonine protein kinase
MNEEAVKAPPTDTAALQAELPGRYRAVRTLGQGGMGVVFLCHDTLLERPVAIKLMSGRTHGDPKAEKRFLREARAQAVINHLNVIKVLNVGVSAHGQPFIVMEYIEGYDLRQALRRQPGGLEPRHLCRITLQVCDGLSAAHDAGVIHRDMKPSNIMVQTDARGVEVVKLLDLGLAKMRGGATDLRTITLVGASMLVGTPAYMSPEQVTGAIVDGRADLYSLGVVLFELLTARLPFESETLEGWLYQHLHSPPPLPSQYRAELREMPELDRVITWMLAKSPHDRPQTARDLAASLRRVLAGESYLAPERPDQGRDSDGLPSRSGPYRAPGASGLSEGLLQALQLEESPSELFNRTLGAPGAPVPGTEEHATLLTPTARRDYYLSLAQAAEEAEERGQWAEAEECWRLAYWYAEDRATVSSRLESLRRQVAFDQALAAVAAAGDAGEWMRAVEILSSAEAAIPGDPRLDQARAQLPRRLVAAWLNLLLLKLDLLLTGPDRDTWLCRLGCLQALSDDFPAVQRLAQEMVGEMDSRIRVICQAACAALRRNRREGLRPPLERAALLAREIAAAEPRARACLEVGRALAAYGDADAARQLLSEALEAFTHFASVKVAPASTTRLAAAAPQRAPASTRLLAAPPDRPADFLAQIAEAQAASGLVEDALATADRIPDAWTSAYAHCMMARALSLLDRLGDAEKVARRISLRMPRDRALRAMAAAQLDLGDPKACGETCFEIVSPEERAPALALLAAHWLRRGERPLGDRMAEEALKLTAQASSAARFHVLLASAEPFLEAAQLAPALPMLAAAGGCLNALRRPADRVQALAQLARVRAKGPGASGASADAGPEVHEILRRALGAFQQVQDEAERAEGLDKLGAAIGEADLADLANELRSQARCEVERCRILLSLSEGLV